MASDGYEPSFSIGNASSSATHSTLYMPIASPPTPAPSPGPQSGNVGNLPMMIPAEPQPGMVALPLNLTQNPALRRQYLSSLLLSCTPSELLFISTTIAPLLKRDFLYGLPPELALHILGFIDEPKTLARAMQVSKHWYKLVGDQSVWKRMCILHEFDIPIDDDEIPQTAKGKGKARNSAPPDNSTFSHRYHFKYHYTIGRTCYLSFHYTLMISTAMNWRHGGKLLRAHRVPTVTNNNPESNVITSISLDKHWVVVGLANSRIHVFSANTGVLARTLVGHDLGVWAVWLVSSGGHWKSTRRKRKPQPTEGPWGDEDLARATEALSIEDEPTLSPSVRTVLGLDIEHDDEVVDEDQEEHSQSYPGRPSYSTGSSDGWGQPTSLVVSAGCDKVLRVWDAHSGYVVRFIPSLPQSL